MAVRLLSMAATRQEKRAEMPKERSKLVAGERCLHVHVERDGRERLFSGRHLFTQRHNPGPKITHTTVENRQTAT